RRRRRRLRARGPARDAQPAVARVETDRDPAGMRATDRGGPLGIRDRERAEHRARRARGERRLHRRPVAEPAAHLHGDAHRGADGSHQVGLHRPPGARAIQVDDVEPARARRLEATSDRHRIVAVHRLAVESALEEPHAAAAAEIDRGIDDHASWRTKLSSSRRPTCWLFSGWNWQAKTLSRTTLDANSGP